MLYFVATPLGNLSDITFRGIEILKKVDYILCEDTRTSSVLLKHYEIHKPLKSYHKFNENTRLDNLIFDLKQGLDIALICDAGTPGICDPGSILIQACRKENIPVSAAPGPCALILALTLSSFSSEKFQFVGFLPKGSSELRRLLAEILHYKGTTICYESPHRLIETLKKIPKTRKVAVLREMTKIYEECIEGTAEEVLSHFLQIPPRGEIVLLIAEGNQDYNHLSPKEHVEFLQKEYGITLQDAIKIASSLRNTSKRELYNIVHDIFSTSC
ncbi:MAG: 16S rRNA (cytidine(1402)-2'-O)-methyltransferase [Chlamydiota bacterium]